jgi:hypothetical protein
MKADQISTEKKSLGSFFLPLPSLSFLPSSLIPHPFEEGAPGRHPFFPIPDQAIGISLDLRGTGPYYLFVPCCAARASPMTRAVEARPSGRSGLTGDPIRHTRQGKRRLSCMACMASMARMGGPGAPICHTRQRKKRMSCMGGAASIRIDVGGPARRPRPSGRPGRSGAGAPERKAFRRLE